MKALLVVAAGLLVLPMAAQAGSMSAAVLADNCAACHGTDGNSPGAIPGLRGKSAAFIEQAMKEYKADTRKGTVMNRLAKGYSDEQITAMAKHLAGN
jgi:sulfide dehydrogenase cytochrome subunit